MVGGSLVSLATLTLGIVIGTTRMALWLWLAIPSGSFAQIVGYSVLVESTSTPDASRAGISEGVGALFFERPDISFLADIRPGERLTDTSSGEAAQTDPVSATLDRFVLSDRCLSVQVAVTLTGVPDNFPQTVHPCAFRDCP